MGLATTDPHSQSVQTKLYKIPKFGVNRLKHKQDTAIWKWQNLQRNVWPSGRCPTQRPDAIHFFVNFDVFDVFAVSRSKLAWLTPNLGFLWISVCSFWLCVSLVANPIINRLVPSPSRFKIRQWSITEYRQCLHCSKWCACWESTVLLRATENCTGPLDNWILIFSCPGILWRYT